MSIKTIGIDLGKTACDVVAMDGRGKVVARRRLSRAKLVAWLGNLPPCLIGMEASCGAYHLARRLSELGHEVRLMPAQYVRPFVKTNKHDQADAEAIGEAVQRPQMRFVPLKSQAQLDLQALHRARDRLVTSRTGLSNQIPAFLRERGVALRQGRLALARALPEVLEATDELSPMLRALRVRLRAQLDDEIAALDQHILLIARAHPCARWLMTIPGIGALIATALVAAIDGGQAFGRGRDLACWLGLVPRQHSTGGKSRLLGIAKRGNGYRRRLLVHAARAEAPRQDPGRSPRRLAAAWRPGRTPTSRPWRSPPSSPAGRGRCWPGTSRIGRPPLEPIRRPGQPDNFCEAVDGMATTVARRRPRMANEPILRGRSGYEPGDARISMTARGPKWASPLQAEYIRADVPASQHHLAEPGRTIHSFGHRLHVVAPIHAQ